MIRRTFLLSLALAIPATSARAQDQPQDQAAAPKIRVYVGTYTNNDKSKGIYQFELDASGALTPKGVAAEVTSPSFLTLHPSGQFLYAANEVSSFAGKREGGVTGFAINPISGKLVEINHRTSGGNGPCHVNVDATGKALLVANYGDGSVASFPIGKDGSLGEAASVIAHKGSGPNKKRQEGPHAHSIDVAPGNKYVAVNDLGLDQTLVYVLDADKATLTPNVLPYAESKPGAGPRHLAFHPNGRVAYVINELDSTVAVLDLNASTGAFSTLQTLSTLPPEFKATNYPAEIAVHPSGRFVYGSNRGADNLAIFAADPTGSKLTPAGYQPTGGKNPRNFAIDPAGQFLLAANQDSDTIVVFRINPQDGTLQQVGEPVAVPRPVCVTFAPILDQAQGR